MTRPVSLNVRTDSTTKCIGAPLALQSTNHTIPPQIDSFYLHIPFCFHKCHYCDFYSIVDDHDRQGAFTERLITELRFRSGQITLRPKTIFVGGGTPTLLRVDLWKRLADALRELKILENVREFTVEANPETLTPELADVLVSAGVDRVSIGAQSFNPTLLKILERWHEPANVARSVKILRQAGFRRINLDLIFAIPGQNMKLLDEDIDRALELEPDHLSYYSLTYEPRTAMTQRLKMKKFEPMEEEAERSMYLHVIDRLTLAGFEHYEISAFARRPVGENEKPQYCQHNLTYWNNGNWLGIGPSAASHINGYRWKNDPHPGRYLQSENEPPTVDHEQLPEAQKLGEELMLRLRLIQGVCWRWLDERLAADDARRKRIEELISINMLESTPTHLRLSRKGLCVGDAVIAELL